MAAEMNPLEPETAPAQEQALAFKAAATLDSEPGALVRVFIGPNGLRSGWSIALFVLLTLLLGTVLSMAARAMVHPRPHGAHDPASPYSALIGETVSVIALLISGWIVARIERRSILDYNLRGPKKLVHFFGGAVVGFAGLTALVSALWAGGWLRFGQVALSGTSVVKYAVVWGAAFVLTGLFEEGFFRCYLQSAFTRGLNFWSALAVVAICCGSVATLETGEARWGVCAMGLLGVAPCLLLHLRGAKSSGFWQAAWVSSLFFGAVHTGNAGENWVGIFAAAFIGLVFCVSVWLTGSAWWAIGCHAAWDWAETFFYGTADSGMLPQGHLLTTSPHGAALWSGGTDGPEGSLLVLPAALLILAVLVVFYRRPAEVVVGE